MSIGGPQEPTRRCEAHANFGRNLKRLVTMLEELQALGIGFVSSGEGIDLGTLAGRLQLHILAALAEFERARIQKRERPV